ncbi:OmpA family protein [Hymenobacter siberiensis]|uniref:OmpA family protein n=1 Tax=Hymenobacter siberiensis TaxID=2848396 RepID=UPI001C1E6107|nr:OmpA family protein [Hymenobacter siberiensis]MBU6121715.1 OmpA family protein [Hymenobacter siberiensis]
MKTAAMYSLLWVLLLGGRLQAQDLSGAWQGVEIHLPLQGYWPALLTLQTDTGSTMTGVLFQEVGDHPDATGTFAMRGTRTRTGMQLDYTKILAENHMSASWCLGTITFSYDAAQEKLTGRSRFKPVPAGNCSTSTFELFRVRLKSASAVAPGVWSTVRVSGREVRWFADPALLKPLATGNSYHVALRQTTIFYIVQNFYPNAHRPVTPITISVKGPLRPKAAAKPPRVAGHTVPMVLPTVLFKVGTSELMPTAAPALDQLAAELKARPALRLRIAGYTDKVGEPDKNQALSEQRAEAVKTCLLKAGIAPERLRTIGYGDSRPLYHSPDARNRRVEVEELQ